MNQGKRKDQIQYSEYVAGICAGLMVFMFAAGSIVLIVRGLI